MIMLLGSFFVVLQSVSFQQDMIAKIPDLSLCSTEIPSLYAGNITRFEAIKDTTQLMRPDLSDREEFDELCQTQVDDKSFYATYQHKKTKNEISQYDIPSGCGTVTTPLENFCPTTNRTMSTTYCPCLSPSDHTICDTFSCQTSTDCDHFEYSTIGICYCMETLQRFIQEEGVWTGFNNAKEQDGDVCTSFLINYASVTSSRVLAVFLTIAINFCLKKGLRLGFIFDLQNILFVFNDVSVLLVLFVDMCQSMSTMYRLIGRMEMSCGRCFLPSMPTQLSFQP